MNRFTIIYGKVKTPKQYSQATKIILIKITKSNIGITNKMAPVSMLFSRQLLDYWIGVHRLLSRTVWLIKYSALINMANISFVIFLKYIFYYVNCLLNSTTQHCQRKLERNIIVFKKMQLLFVILYLYIIYFGYFISIDMIECNWNCFDSVLKKYNFILNFMILFWNDATILLSLLIKRLNTQNIFYLTVTLTLLCDRYRYSSIRKRLVDIAVRLRHVCSHLYLAS